MLEAKYPDGHSSSYFLHDQQLGQSGICPCESAPGRCFPIFISTTKRNPLRGNNRSKRTPKATCGDVRTQEPAAENPTSAKKPLTPPSTQTPPLTPTQKSDHTPHPKLKSPKPQSPHPPPVTFPPPHHPPKQRPPSPPSPLNTRRGACFTSRHQPQTPTNQPQPSSCRPLSLRTASPQSRRRQRTPDRPAAYKMRSKLSGAAPHVAQTGQRNEFRRPDFGWDLGRFSARVRADGRGSDPLPGERDVSGW